MSRYKAVQQVARLTDLIADGCSELESLKDEMTGWRDNMEGTPAENTGKFETVRETADTLENYVDEIDASALPDELKDLNVTYTMHKTTGGRAGPSREMRHADAIAMLQAAADALENSTQMAQGEEEVVNVHTEIGELISNVETVEYPGMYG